MILKNGLVFTEEARFVPADVELADGRIARVAAPGTLSGGEELDAAGRYVTPGFVDIHTHGSKGSDFCDAGAEHIETMSRYMGGEGVTSFCGTTMAFDEALGRLRAFDERVRRRGQDSGERGGEQLLMTAAQWAARERRH